MQRFILFLISILLVLPILLSGQDFLSLTGGITHSELPIYSTKINSRLLRSQPVNKLTFSVAYHQRLNRHLTASAAISYKNLGVNTFNQYLDQAEFFLNSVIAQYLTFSYVPKVELRYGKITLAAGIGGGLGITVNSKSQNFLLVDNNLEIVDRENVNLKELDIGIIFNFELKKVIGNEYNLVILLERYQGFLNASTDVNRQSNLFISDSSVRFGMQIPLKVKKP